MIQVDLFPDNSKTIEEALKKLLIGRPRIVYSDQGRAMFKDLIHKAVLSVYEVVTTSVEVSHKFLYSSDISVVPEGYYLKGVMTSESLYELEELIDDNPQGVFLFSYQQWGDIFQGYLTLN